MPFGCYHLLAEPILSQTQSLSLTPQLFFSLIAKVLNYRARHSIQLRFIQRVTKIRHAVSFFPTLECHTVDCRFQHAIRPITQQISYVD
jgi:hypothetical protein